MWKVNGRRMPSDGKSSHCHWQRELKSYMHFIKKKLFFCNLFISNLRIKGQITLYNFILPVNKWNEKLNVWEKICMMLIFNYRKMNCLNYGRIYIKYVLIIQIVWSLIAILCIKVRVLEYLAVRCEDIVTWTVYLYEASYWQSQSEIGCDSNTKLVSINCMPSENITCNSSAVSTHEQAGQLPGGPTNIGAPW
jgi:hypothetical protein